VPVWNHARKFRETLDVRRLKKMDIKMIVVILLAFIGLMMLIAGWKKAFAKKSGWKTFFMLFGALLLIYAGVAGFNQAGWIKLPDNVGNFFLSTAIPAGGDNGGNNPIVCPQGTVLQGTICVSQGGDPNYSPTGTYSAKDKFSTTVITGTSYYKVNSNDATTTAQTTLNVGDSVTYWISNTSWYVKPVVKTAGKGVNTFEAQGYANSSATLTLYDTVNRQDVTASGAYAPYNTSMGASDSANIELTYQGTADGSACPFGGVLVAEYNSTISKVTATGAVLLSDNPYHVTYSASATSNIGKQWAFGPSLDDGTASVNRISFQFKNGATAVGAGSPYYFKVIPANYYVTKLGDIVLDTEKFADGDTTRTGLQAPKVGGFWGA
jgi:hypothetical protein